MDNLIAQNIQTQSGWGDRNDPIQNLPVTKYVFGINNNWHIISTYGYTESKIVIE